MAIDESVAPKQWRGRFYEDLEIGDVFRSRLGRTISEADNVWFTCLTLNTNQIHFNVPYAERTQFGKPLVNSAFTLALVLGLAVPDTSENAAANLGWGEITLPNPVFVGDTLWAESEITATRATAAMLASASPRKPSVATRSRSASVAILLVACRASASGRSWRAIPPPSSVTRTRFAPPSSRDTAALRAPASRLFSSSSLTTEAGRSTTSPAAMRSATERSIPPPSS